MFQTNFSVTAKGARARVRTKWNKFIHDNTALHCHWLQLQCVENMPNRTGLNNGRKSLQRLFS